MILWLSLAAAAIYGATLLWRTDLYVLSVSKAAAILALAALAWKMDAPIAVVIALLLATVTDVFVACAHNSRNRRLISIGLLGHMLGFLLYMKAFADFGLTLGIVSLAALVVGLCLVAAGMSNYGRAMKDARAATLIYGLLVTALLFVSMMMADEYQLARFGAILLLMSGLLLGYERYKVPPMTRRRLATGPTIWFAYYGGQLLIVLACIGIGV